MKILRLSLLTNVSPHHPDLGVDQVPHPVESPGLPVVQQHPGGVLGGPGHHHEVRLYVEVGLSLAPVLESGGHCPVMFVPENNRELSDGHQDTRTNLARAWRSASCVR